MPGATCYWAVSTPSRGLAGRHIVQHDSFNGDFALLFYRLDVVTDRAFLEQFSNSTVMAAARSVGDRIGLIETPARGNTDVEFRLVVHIITLMR